MSVLCTTLMVFCSAVNGNSRYSWIARFALVTGAPTNRYVVRTWSRSMVKICLAIRAFWT
jgi:hypothetical protein